MKKPRFLTLLLLIVLSGCAREAAPPTAVPPTSAAQASPTSAPPTTVAADTALPQATPTATDAATPAEAEPTPTRDAPVPEDFPPYQPPEWAQGAVIYQLFVRVFTPEGTLKAATERLPELQELGVEIIYLLPIHPIGEERRKGTLGSPYSIRDHRAIDPALGTEEDLREFVEQAHELDMYVIMDFVANHTAWDSVLIEDRGWYILNSAGEIQAPNPDWTDVAELNYGNVYVRRYMSNTAVYWVREFNIDGFRADVADQVPNRFWDIWRTDLKHEREDLLLLSESAGVQMYEAGFEVAYDWDTHPDLITALNAPRMARSALSFVTFEAEEYDNRLWRMRYIENHDQERIAAAARTHEQRAAAAAFLLTLPGLPLIYAGQEVGATERPSLFEPHTVNFDGDQQLRELYAELIALRKATPALRTGSFARLESDQRPVLLYERRADGQRVVVAINMQPEPATVRIPDITAGRDLLTDTTIDLSQGLELTGYGFAIIEVQ